jgi:DNA-binding IclR family transcriptional regulator
MATVDQLIKEYTTKLNHAETRSENLKREKRNLRQRGFGMDTPERMDNARDIATESARKVAYRQFLADLDSLQDG